MRWWPSRTTIPTNFLGTADVVDALRRFPSARPPLAAFIASLGRLQPRLYSISSSLRVHPAQVHLTVGVVRFESQGRWRNGTTSHFLGVRANPGDTIPVFIQRSPKFRLPENPDTPVIMVGPGTGIAPFRAFLHEREAIGAKGRNWLFFGNQYIDLDFLYRKELDGFLDRGILSRLDIAFSRDKAQKVYVQDRMLEHAGELWRWLEDGAYFYVCGDAKRMARDVDQMLYRVVAQARQAVAGSSEAICVGSCESESVSPRRVLTSGRPPNADIEQQDAQQRKHRDRRPVALRHFERGSVGQTFGERQLLVVQFQ